MINVFTVNGTDFSGVADPRDPGQYPVQVAEAVLPSEWQIIADKRDGIATVPLINWIPVPYPAAMYPMGASVSKGVAQLVSLIMATPGLIFLIGYSQGACVTSIVWRDYILNPNGILHDRINDVVGSITWGNPLRCPTIPANGNAYAGWAPQSGGGISGSDDLTAAQTPDWWLDFANPNDLYTDCPVGTAAGSDETLIYNIIMSQDFGGSLEGLLAVIESIIVQFTRPLEEIIGIATAIWNGLRFLVAGPSAGHYTYDITPAISYLRDVAERYA